MKLKHLSLILLLLVSCQNAVKTPDRLYTVAVGSLELNLPETGELGSLQEVQVNAPFDGNLVQLLAEGSVVKKGQVLGRLETTTQQQERSTADLSLKGAQVDLKLAALDRKRRTLEGQANLELAGFDTQIEATRLRQLKEERDTVAMTKVRETLNTLKQQREILELEARERTRLYGLGYLSREERDQAQLQLDQAREQQKAQEAELKTLQLGPRKEDVQRQMLMVDKARAGQRQAGMALKIGQRVADVSRRSAESRIKTYQQRRSYYDGLVKAGTLVAPAAGTLVYGKLKVGEDEVPIKSGDAVQEGVQIVRLVDLSQPVLRLMVHEIDAPRIQPGQMARLRFDAWPDRIYQGKVSKILPVARQPQANDEEEVRLFSCEIRLIDVDKSLRPGMTAQAEIITSTLKQVLLVPTQALLGSGKNTYCLVQTPAGRQQRQVVTGPSDARMTVIQSGLKAGEQVILNPAPLPAPSGARPASPASGGTP